MGTRTAKTLAYRVELIEDDMAIKGWRATDLAKETGYSGVTISKFLNGTIQTSPVAKKIAEALGRSIQRYYVPNAERRAS